MRELLVEEIVNTSAIIENTKHELQQFNNCKLSSLISSYRTIPISFELCPNRNIDWNLLELLKPRFLSITWMVRDINLYIDKIPALLLSKYLHYHDYNVLLHLAGCNFDKQSARLLLTKIHSIGIRNLLILQGNHRSINDKLKKTPDFPYAANFVGFIRQHFQDDFCIAVAGYPDKHPESVDIHRDLVHLKQKVSNGADFIITQACFQYETIENFSKNCRNYSINTPIVAGIFIINSYQSLMKMAEFCDLHIPEAIIQVVNRNRCNDRAICEYGIDLAVNLIKQLLNNPNIVSGVHMFTLNNLNLVRIVLKRLGMIDDWIERPLKYEALI